MLVLSFSVFLITKQMEQVELHVKTLLVLWFIAATVPAFFLP